MLPTDIDQVTESSEEENIPEIITTTSPKTPIGLTTPLGPLTELLIEPNKENELEPQEEYTETQRQQCEYEKLYDNLNQAHTHIEARKYQELYDNCDQ